MNEEEKQAIEYWKTHMEILHCNTQIASEHYIKVLLDLVEKQQKEIKARLEEIDSLYKMMSVKDDEIKYLEQKLEQYGLDYQILKNDIEEHNIAYVDTPEFEEKYISKDIIKEIITEFIPKSNHEVVLRAKLIKLLGEGKK